MRDFFFNILNSLDKLTGIRQMDKLMALPEEESKAEINELLDVLCKTCEMFPLIPQKDQKSILRQALISDGDFIGLNAKWVYKSLAAHKDKYFRELAHTPSEQNPEVVPLTGKQRDEWLQKWQESLAPFQDRIEGTKSHVQELVERLPSKDKGTQHHSTRFEDLMDREMHLQWVRANFDKDGKPLPGFQEEKEWIKKQMEG